MLIFKAPTEEERRILILGKIKPYIVIVSIEIQLLFFNKCSMDCCKPSINFPSSEKVDFSDSSSCCILIAFIEEHVF